MAAGTGYGEEEVARGHVRGGPGGRQRPHTIRVIMNTNDPRDPLGLAADAPLLAAWLNWTRLIEAGQLAPMTTPGHKHREDLVGAVVAGDAPLYGGLDTIKQADRVRADAEERAAALWGADWCRFSVSGSTHGNQAFCLAIGQPGQEVIITRTLHRSLLLGLVLAGLRPVWVRPEIDPGSGLPAAVAVQTVRDALAAHPDACGVILGDPSYVGTTGDLCRVLVMITSWPGWPTARQNVWLPWVDPATENRHQSAPHSAAARASASASSRLAFLMAASPPYSGASPATTSPVRSWRCLCPGVLIGASRPARASRIQFSQAASIGASAARPSGSCGSAVLMITCPVSVRADHRARTRCCDACDP